MTVDCVHTVMGHKIQPDAEVAFCFDCECSFNTQEYGDMRERRGWNAAKEAILAMPFLDPQTVNTIVATLEKGPFA